jgi:hypothetical protein
LRSKLTLGKIDPQGKPRVNRDVVPQL